MVDRTYACLMDPHIEMMIQRNLWMLEQMDLRTYSHRMLHFKHFQQLHQIGVVDDYLVVEHVVVVIVSRQLPVKCLEYLQLVKMYLLVSVQSLHLLYMHLESEDFDLLEQFLEHLTVNHL
ncbi:hypothetical protein Tco_0700191 [Tanacetum coccineum]